MLFNLSLLNYVFTFDKFYLGLVLEIVLFKRLDFLSLFLSYETNKSDGRDTINFTA
jgi:hypothetical protein